MNYSHWIKGSVIKLEHPDEFNVSSNKVPFRPLYNSINLFLSFDLVNKFSIDREVADAVLHSMIVAADSLPLSKTTKTRHSTGLLF